MVVINSPLQSPVIPSLLTRHQSPTRTHLHLPTKQRLTPPIRAQSLHNALSVVADTSASSGGDISVLLPVSAVLFFVYWIANFVVPGMITDDPMKKDSDGEEATSKQQANASETERANTSSRPRQKIKKDDLKKMINQR